MPKLKYIALKCKSIEASKEFYENSVGLSFTKEQHNNGPEHYATVLDNDIVLELYPAIKDGEPPTLGFEVDGETSNALFLDPDDNMIRR